MGSDCLFVQQAFLGVAWKVGKLGASLRSWRMVGPFNYMVSTRWTLSTFWQIARAPQRPFLPSATTKQSN